MPDGEVLIMFACKEHGGRMADDTDGIRIGAPAVYLYTAPDAGVVVVSWVSVHQMELLPAHCQVQVVRQAGEKAQVCIPLLGRCDHEMGIHEFP